MPLRPRAGASGSAGLVHGRCAEVRQWALSLYPVPHVEDHPSSLGNGNLFLEGVKDFMCCLTFRTV